MKPNITVLNKKYNHILTQPAPVPYCKEINFIVKRTYI